MTAGAKALSGADEDEIQTIWSEQERFGIGKTTASSPKLHLIDDDGCCECEDWAKQPDNLNIKAASVFPVDYYDLCSYCVQEWRKDQ